MNRNLIGAAFRREVTDYLEELRGVGRARALDKMKRRFPDDPAVQAATPATISTTLTLQMTGN